MSEDFSVATAAQGDNSSRALAALPQTKRAPTKAKSAYSIFQSAWFKDHAGGELAACSAAWRGLAAVERKKWDALAEKDRKRYMAESAIRDAEAESEAERRREAYDATTAAKQPRARPKYAKASRTPSSERVSTSLKDPEVARRAAELEAEVEAGRRQLKDLSKAEQGLIRRLRESRVKNSRQAELDKQMVAQRAHNTAMARNRLSYLLKQSDVFAHFVGSSSSAKLKQILQSKLQCDDDGASSSAAAASSASPTATAHSEYGKALAPGTSPRRRVGRATEEAEDAKLIAEGAAASAGPMRLTSSPPFIQGVMRDYQIEGLNWLMALEHNGMSGILADEMGLGKTLQSISVLGSMQFFRKISGPHIVIAPKSTLSNWYNELRRWCPTLRPLKFHGSREERAAIVEQHLVAGRAAEDRTFDVVVTTFEVAILEKTALGKFPWRYLVLDEAHRVKNENSRLAKTLQVFSVGHRLLLTGTPLQNNLHELWALLHFLLPEIFTSSEDFDEWFNLTDSSDDEAKQNMVTQLHRLLKPFMLRRLKKDVAKSIPPKKETLLFVGLSEMQRSLYKKILERDMDTVAAIGGGKSNVKLLNILMQLRKCCNHPYLFEGVEDRSLDPMGDHLIINSGKLALLDKLLPRLKSGGHRVLIFSQMTRLLDILEDYCEIRGHSFCRIDGNTSYEDRDDAISSYNAPGSKDFVFLLSTRAGGLGINLATADTVILYDSDWNPQVDLQAQDRAHRIGQTKPVHIYRLVTESSVEEKVIERAEMKLRLDAVVIQQGRLSEQNKALSKNEMVEMIRYGAESVFKSSGSSISDDDIDAIIHRGERKTAELSHKLQEHVKGDLLDFKLDGGGTMQEFEGTDYSAKLKEKRRQEEEEERQRLLALGFMSGMSDALGKRTRNNPSTYNETQYWSTISFAGGTGGAGRQTKARRQVLPKHLRLPRSMRDWQLFDRNTLYAIAEKEEAEWKRRVAAKASATASTASSCAVGEEGLASAASAAPEAASSSTVSSQGGEGDVGEEDNGDISLVGLLDPENEAAKARLISEGFPNWTRQQYGAFIKACESYGRTELGRIADAVEGKSLDEVTTYAASFWERGPKLISNWDSVEASIVKAEKRLEEVRSLMCSLKEKIALHSPHVLETLDFVPSSGINHNRTGENRFFTKEENAFLLSRLDVYGYTTDVGAKIKRDVFTSEYTRFSTFLRTRTEEQLRRRCLVLLRVIPKDLAERKKIAAAAERDRVEKAAKAEAERRRKIEKEKERAIRAKQEAQRRKEMNTLSAENVKLVRSMISSACSLSKKELRDKIFGALPEGTTTKGQIEREISQNATKKRVKSNGKAGSGSGVSWQWHLLPKRLPTPCNTPSSKQRKRAPKSTSATASAKKKKKTTKQSSDATAAVGGATAPAAAGSGTEKTGKKKRKITFQKELTKQQKGLLCQIALSRSSIPAILDTCRGRMPRASQALVKREVAVMLVKEKREGDAGMRYYVRDAFKHLIELAEPVAPLSAKRRTPKKKRKKKKAQPKKRTIDQLFGTPAPDGASTSADSKKQKMEVEYSEIAMEMPFESSDSEDDEKPEPIVAVGSSSSSSG